MHKDLFAPAHGSILIFMPGVPEINKLARLLQQHYKHDAPGAVRMKILPLHGNLSPNEQKVVFHNAGHNEIKIVISTNVAEASVTIPDVSVVIDTCKVKEIQFDTEIQTSVLTTKFAALDSLRQRRGRAGALYFYFKYSIFPFFTCLFVCYVYLLYTYAIVSHFSPCVQVVCRKVGVFGSLREAPTTNCLSTACQRSCVCR